MKQSFFKVLSQGEAVTVMKQDGSHIQKSTLVLQEFGGRYEDTFVASLLGNQIRFYPNDLVLASLRFTHREHNGNTYQDITILDIVSFTPHI